QGLIDALLRVSRVGRGDTVREPVDTRQLAEETVATFRERLDETGAEVRIGALPVVMGDHDLLSQLFQNLIGNALKFTDGRPPVIDVTAVQDGGAWRFSVRDNGI